MADFDVPWAFRREKWFEINIGRRVVWAAPDRQAASFF
jgi:hypothetical protein